MCVTNKTTIVQDFGSVYVVREGDDDSSIEGQLDSKFADSFAVVYPRHLGIMRKVIDEEKNCQL